MATGHVKRNCQNSFKIRLARKRRVATNKANLNRAKPTSGPLSKKLWFKEEICGALRGRGIGEIETTDTGEREGRFSGDYPRLENQKR